MDSAPTPTPPILPNHQRFPKRLLFLIPAILILVSIPLIIFLSSNKKTATPIEQPPGPKPAKSWEIIFVYDVPTQALTVKNVQIRDVVLADPSFDLSPYKLIVLDKNGQSIFTKNITISESILYLITEVPESSASGNFPQPSSLESLINIPYFDQADKIQVTKNNQLILEFIPPKQLSFNLIPEVQALPASCQPLNLVFVSDGYTDMNKFHQQVDNFKQVFQSTPPYNIRQIFNFLTWDNPASHPLGCMQNGNLNMSCMDSASIPQQVLSQFPTLPNDSDYTKIMVLVDGGPQPMGGGSYTIGAAKDIGAYITVFQTRVLPTISAIHEVEGHAVGQLYDRYIYPNGHPNSLISNISIKSNCTNNPSGEAFWQSIGVQGAFQGCTSNYLYAPTPRDCGVNGTRTSLMSSGNCQATAFDPVEQEWIKTRILPKYSDVSCLNPSPSPSPSPSRSPSSNPSSSVSPVPSPSASVPRISPSPSPSIPTISPSPNTPTTSNNPSSGGPPTSAPPDYYTDDQPNDFPIPYVCYPTQGTAGQQIQLGYLVCTPR